MKLLTIPFSRCSGVPVGPIFVHIIIENLSFGPKNVCSWGIVLSIKATSAFMCQQIVSTYLVMLSLMRTSSPFLPCHSHPPQPHPCIHLLLCLANLKMLHIRLCCYLIMVQELDVVLAWNSYPMHHLRRLWRTSIGRCMRMHRLPPSTPSQEPRLPLRLGRRQ